MIRSSAYILEDSRETARLEKQDKLSTYNLAQEFEALDLKPRSILLDAGCGSGRVPCLVEILQRATRVRAA